MMLCHTCPGTGLRPLNSDLLPTSSHTGNCLGLCVPGDLSPSTSSGDSCRHLLGSPIPPTRLKMGMTNDYSADATGRVHEC